MSTPAAVIDISRLDFSYGGARGATRVLAGIDLAVAPGTTLGVIGPNGGGKTTLMRLMLGLLEPTAGSIRSSRASPGGLRSPSARCARLRRLRAEA